MKNTMLRAGWGFWLGVSFFLIPTLHAQNTPRVNTQLSIDTPPSIDTPSSPIILKEGIQNEIPALVSGQPTPQIQWFFNGAAISGGTNATLILPAVTRAQEGTYWLVASNTLGQATSATVIAAVVSNVDPERFVGLRWQGNPESGLLLESTDRLGSGAVWHTLSNYPPAATEQRYVERNPIASALLSAEWLRGLAPVYASWLRERLVVCGACWDAVSD